MARKLDEPRPLLRLLLMSPLLVSVTSDCYHLLISEDASAVAGARGRSRCDEKTAFTVSFLSLAFPRRQKMKRQQRERALGRDGACSMAWLFFF